MNRISKAWRSLGRARQILSLLLVVLTLLQACLLILWDRAWLLPFVAIAALLGLVQVKQSAVTKDAINRLLRNRNDMAAMKDAVNRSIRNSNKNFTATNKVLARVEKTATATALTRDSSLALLREQVGQTSGQFTWLGERMLESETLLGGVQSAAQESAAAVTAQQNRIAKLEARLDSSLTDLSDLIASSGAKVAADITGIEQAISPVVGSIENRLIKAFDGGNSHSLERRLVAELSALALLHEGVRHPDLPPLSGWAMSPLTVRAMRSYAKKLDSRCTIVELGSGISTAWTASALAQLEDAPRYVAVDHSPQYAAATQQYIDDLGVAGSVEIVLAPLEPVTYDGVSAVWYGTDWISDVQNVGLLVVDGPPAGKDSSARFPALPLLVDCLANEATIIIDDVDRPGESEMVSQWLSVPGVTKTGPVGRSMVLAYVRPEPATR